MVMNPNALRTSRAAGNVNAAKGTSALDVADSAVNKAVMGPMVIGLFAKGLSWIGNTFKSKGIVNFARKYGEADRTMNTKSISELVGGAMDRVPAVSSAFGTATGKVGEVMGGTQVGKAVTSGQAAGVIDRLANATGISKIFKWYQKQNGIGAQNFHNVLADQITAASSQARELGQHGIGSQLDGLLSKVRTVEDAHRNGGTVMKEMQDLAKKVNGLRVDVVGQQAKGLSSLHRDISHTASTVSNVINKAEKANYSSLSHYITDLPKRWGSKMTATTALFGATNVLLTANNVKNTVQEGRGALQDLHKVYTQMTGKTISDKQLLSSNDVPDAIKTMRKSMRGTLGNLGVNLAAFAGSQVVYMRAGANWKSGMIAMALQQGASSLAGLVIPKSESLAAFNVVEEAQAKGEKVKASTYIDVIATVNKETARSGQYGQTQMRADYLALYAEEHQMKAGELLALADKAGKDPAVKQQLTAEVQAGLDAKKQAAAQAKFDAQEEINPNARTDNVRRLHERDTIAIGQAPAGQARA